jgi:hypothetical protein
MKTLEKRRVALSAASLAANRSWPARPPHPGLVALMKRRYNY